MDARIGYVSSYNAGKNKASVVYQDRQGQVTKEFPILAPGGVKQILKKGEPVLVIHLSNGSEEAVIIGPIGYGAAAMDGESELTLRSGAGSITVSDLLKIRKKVGV